VIFDSGEAHSTSTTQDTKSSKTQAVEGSVDGENVINSHTQNTVNSLRIKGRIHNMSIFLSITSSTLLEAFVCRISQNKKE
jgi:hypothetical protein